MKKSLAILLMALALSLMTAATSSAAVFKSGDNLVLNELLNDDSYVAGGNVNVEQDVFGDLFVAGGNLTINGNISEDLVVAGGMITINGDVGDDLRIMGGNITINGNVTDDLIVAGGQVDVSKNTVIGGSLITGAGYLTLNGNVTGDIRGAGGMLVLNGNVGGNVDLTVEEKLSVSENAVIQGDLSYSALSAMEIPEQSVKGKILFNKFDKGEYLREVTYAYLIAKAISFVSALVLILVFVLMCPRLLMRAAALTKEKALKSFGVGFLALVCAFLGTLILMVTIIGIPLGMIMLALIMITFIVAKVFVVSWLLGYVMDFNKIKSHLKLKMFFALAATLLVYQLVALIPFVGWAINLVLFITGVGTMVMIKHEYFMHLKDKKMV